MVFFMIKFGTVNTGTVSIGYDVQIQCWTKYL